jgi:Pectate lyase superfamily protein
MKPLAIALIPSLLLAQSSALLPVPIQQPLNNTGGIQAGGCIYTYQAGTTTGQTTYRDSTKTTPNTNPIVLDSYGRAPAIYFDVPLKVAFGAKLNGSCPSSPGFTYWTQDNVTDGSLVLKAALATTSSTPANNGAASIGYQQPGSSTGSTVQAKLSQFINVKDFGVKCDGSTDDYTALTAAISGAGSNNTLYFPPGSCRTSGTLHPISGQVWLGAGASYQYNSGQTTLTYTGGSNSPVVGPSGTSTDVVNFWMMNISINGSNLANPLVNWYRISEGGIIGGLFQGTYSNANGVLVDSGAGQAYRNLFSRIKCDTMPGACIIFQNGANANTAEHIFVINQGSAGSGTMGARTLYSASNNRFVNWDVEFLTDGGGAATGTAFDLESPANVIEGGTRIEKVGTGINLSSAASQSRIACNTIMTTSVTTPLTVDSTIAYLNDICFLAPSTGNTQRYFGWRHEDITSYSGGTTLIDTLYPQTNTANIYRKFDYGLVTSGTHATEFYNNTTKTVWFDHASGNFHAVGAAYFANDLFTIQGVTSGAATIGQIDPIPPSNSTEADLYLFRNTTTSGTRHFSIFKGDGTSSKTFEVDASNGAVTAIGKVQAALATDLGYFSGCTHGANATCGVSTLASGTVTVSTTAIGTLAAAGAGGFTVLLTPLTCSSCGALSVGTVNSGTSFVINSTNGSDASRVYWEIKYIY